MRRSAPCLLFVALLGAPVAAQSTNLLYRIEGTLIPFAGPDTSLEGAFIRFTGTIDSDTKPFADLKGRRSFAGDSPATVALIGSPTADGLYTDALDHPMSIFVSDRAPSSDLLQVWHNGYFPLQGASGPRYEFEFTFSDSTGEVFDNLGVPGTNVGLADFDDVFGWLTYPGADGNVAFAYQVDVTKFEIVPEPATLFLLLAGAAALLFHRRTMTSA